MANDPDAVRITLFVAEGTPSAALARETLPEVLAGCALDPAPVRIVDVFESAVEALMAGIIATPALLVETGGERRVFLGDFRRRQDLEAFLAALRHRRPLDSGGRGAWP